jgi:hypothetical protein
MFSSASARLPLIIVSEIGYLAFPSATYGDRHWPLVGFHDVGTIAPIRQYQLTQETVGRITVRLVTDETLTPDQKIAFTDLPQKALGYEILI